MVDFYEGRLPEAVARDLEFARAFTMKGAATDVSTFKTEEIPDKEYIHVRNLALDDATTKMEQYVDSANKGKRNANRVHLLADPLVAHEEKGAHRPAYDDFHPTYSLVLQAIGYRRKPKGK